MLYIVFPEILLKLKFDSWEIRTTTTHNKEDHSNTKPHHTIAHNIHLHSQFALQMKPLG